jgi:thioredoxin 1
MAEKSVVNVTDAEFEREVLNSEGISVVDFWSPRCGPCRTMAPILEGFAENNAGKVKAYKLDVDDNPKTAEKFEIRSVPTLIFFKDGKQTTVVAGTLSASSLQEKADAILSAG